MSGAIRCPGCEACIEIEWVMVRLKVRAALLAVIDDLSLFVGWPAPVGQRCIPASRIPDPGDVLGRERIADRLHCLRRNRLSPKFGPLGIAQIRLAIRRGRDAARLIERLRGIYGV